MYPKSGSGQHGTHTPTHWHSLSLRDLWTRWSDGTAATEDLSSERGQPSRRSNVKWLTGKQPRTSSYPSCALDATGLSTPQPSSHRATRQGTTRTASAPRRLQLGVLPGGRALTGPSFMRLADKRLPLPLLFCLASHWWSWFRMDADADADLMMPSCPAPRHSVLYLACCQLCHGLPIRSAGDCCVYITLTLLFLTQPAKHVSSICVKRKSMLQFLRA